MIELLLQDPKSGVTFDLQDNATNIKWDTQRKGRPGKLTFTLPKYIRPPMGSIVRFKLDGQKVFYGYVFKYETDRTGSERITAYDQLRYLKNKDTFVFSSKTATEVISKIASTFGLKTASLIDTSYVIPTLLEDNKMGLDVILKALDKTLIATGEMFYLYDNFGELTLGDVKASGLLLQLGDKANVTGYKYSESIDSDTYNTFKLVRDNPDTKKRDVYVAQDSTNQTLWGILQYYEKVNDNETPEQITDKMNALSALKNRVTKDFSLDGAIGDTRVRGGSTLFVQLDALNLNLRLLVESAKHTLDTTGHTMDLTLAVI